MDKLDQKVTLLNLIVEDLEFQFSKRLVDHPNNSRLKDIKGKYNGIIRNTDLFYYTYAIEDDRIHHESRYGNDFRETDYSLNFNHRTDDTLSLFRKNQERMILESKMEKNDMVIINKDEDEFNGFKVKKETSFDFKMFNTPKRDDKEKSTVSGFEDCLLKGLFRQVVEPDNSIISFGNPFRVSRNDMPKHRLDGPPSFSLGPEFDDFSIEEINQTNVKDANISINPKIKSRDAFSETNTHCSKKKTLSQTSRMQVLDCNRSVKLVLHEVLTADTLFIMDEESDP
ncbi:hypothetical protein Tco_1463126, partial [Tanacetum coccineum]